MILKRSVEETSKSASVSLPNSNACSADGHVKTIVKKRGDRYVILSMSDLAPFFGAEMSVVDTFGLDEISDTEIPVS